MLKGLFFIFYYYRSARTGIVANLIAMDVRVYSECITFKSHRKRETLQCLCHTQRFLWQENQ